MSVNAVVTMINGKPSVATQSDTVMNHIWVDGQLHPKAHPRYRCEQWLFSSANISL
jgi:hypothetical protein